jgi:16S rRNA G966 N2-methylase RsmD
MFSGLDSTHVLYGRRFLDLYAGSGAVGLEAASRGAEHVLLVESDPKAVRVIRENIAALGVGHLVTLAAQRVISALAAGPTAGPTAGPAIGRGNDADGPNAGPSAGRGHLAAGPANGRGHVAADSSSDGFGKGYDIVFADPPYDLGEADVTAMLDALVGHGWINAGGLVILERSKRSPEPTWVQSVTAERSRRYGEAMLWYGRRS